VRIGWWDLAFYGLFGLVVTTFVQIGGVLLTFSYLIIPAVCASYLANRLVARLWTAWAIAMLGGALGAGASYKLDLPTGGAIVCMLGVLLLMVQAFSALRRSTRQGLHQPGHAPVQRLGEVLASPQTPAKKGTHP
jgi:ABC-type Mn2+/Zn2+ transport system permease subunit